jgi:hypothetical protein
LTPEETIEKYFSNSAGKTWCKALNSTSDIFYFEGTSKPPTPHKKVVTPKKTTNFLKPWTPAAGGLLRRAKRLHSR